MQWIISGARYKDDISANYQFKNIDEHADLAEHWVLSQQK
jgi:hypothetical protein